MTRKKGDRKKGDRYNIYEGRGETREDREKSTCHLLREDREKSTCHLFTLYYENVYYWDKWFYWKQFGNTPDCRRSRSIGPGEENQ